MRLQRHRISHKVVCGVFFSCLLVYCECESRRAAARAAPRPPVDAQEAPEKDSGQIIKEQDAEEGTQWRKGSKIPGFCKRVNECDNKYVLVGVHTLGGKNLAAGPVYATHDQVEIPQRHSEENENQRAGQIQEVQCSKPVAPEHGVVHGDDFSIDATVYFFCHEGYHITGPEHATCLPVPDPFHHVAIWEPQNTPQCLPDEEEEAEEEEEQEEEKMTEVHGVHCPEPEALENGHVRGTDYYIGARVDYYCDPGYTLVGPGHVICMGVPDPFHHVAIWEPSTKPRCLTMEAPPSTLPLVLVPHPSMSRASDTFEHRRTDFKPKVNEIEGLPTICSLPKEKGPCKAAIPRYYFDYSILECSTFAYGGCDGNGNNFETFEECQQTCA